MDRFPPSRVQVRSRSPEGRRSSVSVSRQHPGARRELAVRPAVEAPPGLTLSDAAPLLEEERHTGRLAPVADASYPIRRHRPGTRPALAAYDDPREATPGERAANLQEP